MRDLLFLTSGSTMPAVPKTFNRKLRADAEGVRHKKPCTYHGLVLNENFRRCCPPETQLRLKKMDLKAMEPEKPRCSEGGFCSFKTDPDGDEACARCRTHEPIFVQTGAGPWLRELEECSSVVGSHAFFQPSNWGVCATAMCCDLCACDGIPKHIRKLLKKSLFEPEVFLERWTVYKRSQVLKEFGSRLMDSLLPGRFSVKASHLDEVPDRRVETRK